jgi:hypothetical protein
MRAHLLRTTSLSPASPIPSPAATEYARLGGKSDAILKEKTGCTWERWVKTLDRANAHTWPHSKIAKYVMEKYRIPGWWAQTVTVGYERIKGRRAVGQRMDGSFEASKTKTFPVPLARLYRAFSHAPTRARWLSDVEVTIRTAARNKSMRMAWPDRTAVAVWFLSKGPGKSQLALAHGKLPDRSTADQMKQYWSKRLDSLQEILMKGET